MAVTKLSTKGQVVLPKEVRDTLGLSMEQALNGCQRMGALGGGNDYALPAELPRLC